MLIKFPWLLSSLFICVACAVNPETVSFIGVDEPPGVKERGVEPVLMLLAEEVCFGFVSCKGLGEYSVVFVLAEALEGGLDGPAWPLAGNGIT